MNPRISGIITIGAALLTAVPPDGPSAARFQPLSLETPPCLSLVAAKSSFAWVCLGTGSPPHPTPMHLLPTALDAHAPPPPPRPAPADH